MTKPAATLTSDTPSPLIAPRPSLGEEVYERLLGEIIALRRPPGERLSVDGLSRAFGVSQTPIRAALIRLEAEGLVSKKHNTGYSVSRQLSAERFRDIYEFRQMVEPGAAALAARNADSAGIAEMRRLSDEMKAMSEDESEATYSRFALLDQQFHASVARAGGNAVVTEALERLHVHMHLFRLRFHASVTLGAVIEHESIVAAIVAGDSAAAEAAMRAHIQSSQERMEPFYNPET